MVFELRVLKANISTANSSFLYYEALWEHMSGKTSTHEAIIIIAIRVMTYCH